MEGIKTEILEVRFEDTTQSEDNQPGVKLDLLDSLRSSNDENCEHLLYKPQPSDPCRVLSSGSKVAVAYTVKPKLVGVPVGETLRSTLGLVSIDWKPSPLPFPADVPTDTDDAFGGFRMHGPLRLEAPATIRFSGPSCRIDNTPFEAVLYDAPATPKMGVPFGVRYKIKNKTSQHQLVSVHVVDPMSSQSSLSPGTDEGLLFSGMTQGELSLAPSEEQSVSYTILATRAGKVRLPALEISSDRFSSWIVKENTPSRDVYIIP